MIHKEDQGMKKDDGHLSSTMTTQNSAESAHRVGTTTRPFKRVGQSSSLKVTGESKNDPAESVQAEAASGRERLKRHRVEVAGRVWIPDVWGQEELLKDWVDCTAFDGSLVSSTIMSARAALVEEGRIRANSGGLRIVNRC